MQCILHTLAHTVTVPSNQFSTCMDDLHKVPATGLPDKPGAPLPPAQPPNLDGSWTQHGQLRQHQRQQLTCTWQGRNCSWLLSSTSTSTSWQPCRPSSTRGPRQAQTLWTWRTWQWQQRPPLSRCVACVPCRTSASLTRDCVASQGASILARP